MRWEMTPHANWWTMRVCGSPVSAGEVFFRLRIPQVGRPPLQNMFIDWGMDIDQAAAVGAPAVVLVCGAVPGQSLQESRKQIVDGIAAVLPHADACGVNLSIEPLHPIYAADRSAVNTMGQARRMCEQLNGSGETRVGIAADVYHIWFDDALEAEIMASGKQGWLHAFHICDWKVEQADPLHDRGLMGEGVIDIRTIEGWMSKAGYQGDIEVEIFSKHHWAKDPSVFLDEILMAYDACL